GENRKVYVYKPTDFNEANRVLYTKVRFTLVKSDFHRKNYSKGPALSSQFLLETHCSQAF
ncbi:MAG: hypothetical protein ACI9NN_001190, partial [Bacteroidia bacterium]